MTVKAVVNVGRLVEAEGQHKMLRALIDWPALRRLGWDPKREISLLSPVTRCSGSSSATRPAVTR